MTHGSEDTHYCCNKRLEEYGGAATCCECDPHEGCEFNKPTREE